MQPIFKAQNLNFIYNKGKDNEYHALINVNLEIYPEEFVIIFGPSGCGKSSLLNILAGLESPESGNIFLHDRDISRMSKEEFTNYHRKELGVVYQAYNLIRSLTVLENVALPQVFIGISRGKRNQWAKTLLERFGILKHANKIPTELSGGQQQRIGIARAIVNNPQIILADEPVGNLDSISAKNVLDILKDLNVREKKTVILVTHNPENLEYGDRIIYMKDGIVTREVVSKGMKSKTQTDINKKSPTAEMGELMRAYRGLTPDQINILIMPYKAKVFAHHFTSQVTLEETRIFEDLIQRRLLGTISQEEFFDILNRPDNQGGVGFDKRKAVKMLRRINRLMRISFFVYQKRRQRKNEKGEHIKITDDEKAEKVTDYLLKTCYLENYHKLYGMQILRIQKAVSDRINGKFQKSDFYNFLDSSYSGGGVGLNKKTAKAISEEMELILILGYGIMNKLSLPNPQDAQEDSGLKDRNTKEEAKKTEGEAAKDEDSEQDAPKKADGKRLDPEINKYREIISKEIEAAERAEKEKSQNNEIENKPDKNVNIEMINKAPSLHDAMLAAQTREKELKK
jgi:putative ABC transport system ATP-binding protein